MAISLNDHEARIKKLEQNGAISFGENTIQLGKFIIQWGNAGTIYDHNWVTKNFPIPFPNQCICIVDGIDGLHFDSVSRIRIVDRTRYKVASNNRNGISDWKWIAIGYLISNRILNHAYAYVKSLRDFKVMIKSHFFCLISKFTREVI